VKICRTERVDEIVLALPWSAIGPIERLATLLRVLPLPVRLIPDTSVLNLLRQPMTDIGWAMAIDLQREPMHLSERIAKRALDLVVAWGALLFFSPVILIAALLIKLESPGPVFFRQSRIGFSGRCFRIWKFRTMTTLDDGGEIKQAQRGDARVTRVGAWLRRTSLDEIPQFFNVLAGEMSVVGPRPHALAHDDQYHRAVAGYAFRHHMKPGITGWAQVRGLRGQTPTVGHMAARVEQDIWYINNWNLLLDIKIVVLTFGALVRGVNAY
jgi:Undecaprenyl-phosphate glucose phosphotransferase